jgi:hypothetical protein
MLFEKVAVNILPIFLVTTAVLNTEPKLSRIAAFSGNVLDLFRCQKVAVT